MVGDRVAIRLALACACRRAGYDPIEQGDSPSLDDGGGAEARGATLTVWTSDAAQDPGEVRIYRVFEDWSEGGETGAPGEASWDERQPGRAWSSPGCGVGSRDAAARAEMAIVAASTRHEVDLPASVVQGWIDDPSSNRGLALVATGGAGVELVSGDSRDVARRPTLAIEW